MHIYNCLFNIYTWMLTRYLKLLLSRIFSVSNHSGPILPFLKKKKKSLGFILHPVREEILCILASKYVQNLNVSVTTFTVTI